MLLERLGVSVAELVQQPRRPLDDRKEEGDRSGRELGHQARPSMPPSMVRGLAAGESGSG